MTDKALVIFDTQNPHQSIRLVWGLNASNVDVTVVNTPDLIKSQDFRQYDFVFVEASTDIDLSDKHVTGPSIILYDVEDKPSWFDPKKGYYSLLDKTKFYGKYNYQPQYPNKDGLKYIGLPQVDYINKGAVIAQQVYPALKSVPEDWDVFFRGGPTYLTDYHPKDVPYTKREGLSTLAEKPEGTGHPWESKWLYNQRLEWVDQINRDGKLKIKEAGLHYVSDPTAMHPLSIQYHQKVFGYDCIRYMSQFTHPNDYYHRFMCTPIGLNPAGVARSSYRIIELMALGRTIISTDMEGYKYLYNPKIITTIPDGDYLPNIIRELREDKNLVYKSKENMEIFATLTPEKMWSDFKSQL